MAQITVNSVHRTACEIRICLNTENEIKNNKKTSKSYVSSSPVNKIYNIRKDGDRVLVTEVKAITGFNGKLISGGGKYGFFSSKSGRKSLKIRASASDSPYEILGVGKNATDREIKTAYRKLALKYHPDVNKAADAQATFVRIKQAYQTLSDPALKSKYERASSGGSRSNDFDPFSWADNYTKQKQKEKEEFYGFDDFFRDLRKDSEARQSQKGGRPKSLWEELQEIGVEFVDFLEKNLPEDAKPETETSYSKKESGSTGYKYTETTTHRRSSSSSSPSPGKSMEEELDEMLSKLKKEMGL